MSLAASLNEISVQMRMLLVQLHHPCPVALHWGALSWVRGGFLMLCGLVGWCCVHRWKEFGIS